MSLAPEEMKRSMIEFTDLFSLINIDDFIFTLSATILACISEMIAILSILFIFRSIYFFNIFNFSRIEILLILSI